MNFLSLPEEILLHILTSLNGPDLLAFASVNKYTNTFYKLSSRLQYIAELDLAGCLDESLDTSSVAHSHSLTNSSTAQNKVPNSSEKLAYLRTRERNWRTLDLTRNAKRIPLDHPTEVSVYDLSGGVFGYAEFGREHLLRYLELREVSKKEGILDEDGDGDSQSEPPEQGNGDNDVARTPTDGHTENEDEIPKLLRSDVPWETFPFDGPGHVADFGLALKEHDLIVFISYNAKEWDGVLRLPSLQVIKLNLCQFSTRIPHPYAKEPTIPLAEKASVYARPSPIIEVSGKYVIVLLTFPRAVIRQNVVEDLFIINWHTGRIIYHQLFDASTYSAVALVTPSLLVLPNLAENALDLFYICSPSGCANTEGKDIECVVLLRRLRLPEMTSNFKLQGAVCRGDPNPTSSTFDPLARDAHGSVTGARVVNQEHESAVRRRKWGATGFGVTADPTRAIVSFKLIIVHSDATIPYGPALNLVVHRSALALLVQPALARFWERVPTSINPQAAMGPGINEVEWKEWGPKVTRWRLEDDYVEWVTTTAGQRQVFTSLAPDTDERWWKSVLVVRDYNPFGVKRMKARAMQQRARERTEYNRAEGKGKGKDLEDDQGRIGDGTEIRIHVDSIDGERVDDSEDEDELGLGANEDAAPGMTPAPMPGPLPVMVEAGIQADPVPMEGIVVEGEDGGANATSHHLRDEPDEPLPEPAPAVSSLPLPKSSGSGSSLSSPGIPPPSSAPDTSTDSQASTSSGSTATLGDHADRNYGASDAEPHGPDAATSPALPSQTYPLPFINPVSSSSTPLKLISIRIRDTMSTTKVRYYKHGDLTGGLPCVEYVLNGCEALFSGVLMDEERIIGYLEDAENPEQIERMSQMCVFSMYP